MKTDDKPNRFKKTKLFFLIGTMFFILIQLWPYGRNHTNPPVIAEPKWDSAMTRDRFYRSCGDCHSNQSVWPWYSQVAPVSWLVQRDVDKGRQKVNVSEWGVGETDAGESAAKVKDGEMPPWFYVIPHPSAKMSDKEKQDFINGLTATFGSSDDDNDDD